MFVVLAECFYCENEREIVLNYVSDTSECNESVHDDSEILALRVLEHNARSSRFSFLAWNNSIIRKVCLTTRSFRIV